MKKGIWQEFDGYAEVAEAIEYSKKHGQEYLKARDIADPYIDRLHPARLKLRVADIFEETPSTSTFRLTPEQGTLPPFQAGQYIALFFDIGGVRTGRPYSISSPPNQIGCYDVTVRRVEDGLVSNFMLDEVRKGDLIDSSGPEGHFYYNPLFHDSTMVCLAGGSGITPFMSMIREIVECGLDRTVYLFYGSKDLEEAVFHEKLEEIAARNENIHYHPVLENLPYGFQGLSGLITGDLIKNIVGDFSDKTFYLCGPQGMYDFCLPELDRQGAPKRKIRKEVYGPPQNVCASPGWPEDVKADDIFKVSVSGGPVMEAPAGQSLLTSLEKSGLLIPSLCRSGECSMCRVKVAAGKVFQPEGTPVRKSDQWFGYVHSCVSYPLENLEIVL